MKAHSNEGRMIIHLIISNECHIAKSAFVKIYPASIIRSLASFESSFDVMSLVTSMNLSHLSWRSLIIKPHITSSINLFTLSMRKRYIYLYLYLSIPRQRSQQIEVIINGTRREIPRRNRPSHPKGGCGHSRRAVDRDMD